MRTVCSSTMALSTNLITLITVPPRSRMGACRNLNVLNRIRISFISFDKFSVYRVSQEECARLRESVPYVKLYRYNPKHLCPK